jgi:hypothetical protein
VPRLRQLRAGLLRDASEHAVNILQDAGFAASWRLPGVARGFRSCRVERPEDLDAAARPVLTEFFQASGWGANVVGGQAALALDSGDWAEAGPGGAGVMLLLVGNARGLPRPPLRAASGRHGSQVPQQGDALQVLSASPGR